MLIYYLYLTKYLCYGALIVSLLIAACAGYAYAVNSQRPEEDPEKKQYRPAIWLLTIFTWPVLIPVVLSLFLLRVLLYGFFFLGFTIFMFLIPPETRERTWVESRMLKVGNLLLEANSFLIKVMLRPWTTEPKTI